MSRPATPLEQPSLQTLLTALEQLHLSVLNLQATQDRSTQEQETARQERFALNQAVAQLQQPVLHSPQVVETTPKWDMNAVSKFNGDSSTYRTWKSQLCDYLDLFQLSEKQKVTYMSLHLTGEAETYFINLRVSSNFNPHFGSVMSLMDARFIDVNASFRAIRKLDALKLEQKPMNQHLNEFNSLLFQSELNVDDVAKCRKLVSTLPEKLQVDIRRAALDNPALLSSYTLLERRLLDWEAVDQPHVTWESDYMQLNSMPTSYPSNKEDALQRLKAKLGVSELKKLNFCLDCVEYVGYPAKHPPGSLCKRNKPLINYLYSLSGSLYVSLDFSNGISLKALVDSGAQGYLYLSKNATSRVGTTLLRTPRPKLLKTFQGDTVASVEHTTTHLTFHVCGKSLRSKFDVIPDLPMDAIIGYEFLRRHSALIDFEKQKLLFVPPHSWSRLRMLADNSNMSTQNDAEVLIADTSNTFEQNDDEVLILASITDPVPIQEAAVPAYLTPFQDVFSAEAANRLPPLRPGIDMELNLKQDHKPLRSRMYKLSNMEVECMRDEIEKGLASGKIRKSRSAFGSPVLFVKKPDGSLRMCVDYRMVNDATESIKASLPLIDDLLQSALGSSLFSKIDLKGAFNLIRMAPGSEHLTAFMTKFGLFEYVEIPFGLKNGPTVFQSFMNSIFSDLMGRGMDFFIDDILVYEKDATKHKELLIEIFKRLHAHGLAVGLDKCLFMVPEVDFLEHHLSCRGLTMQTSKVQSILDFNIPRSIKDLRSFLGICNYYRAFIPNFSKIAAPLNALTGKSTYKLTPEVKSAFENLKSQFTKGTILAAPDRSKPFYLQTDASDFAMGAVLHQRDDLTGKLRPLGFLSRKFKPSEINYDIHDKELLAIVDSFDFWRYLLIDTVSPTIVHCDHRNLGYFRAVQQLSRRQARWYHELQEYEFIIQFKQGSEIKVADPLSRNPSYSTHSGDPERMVNKVMILPPTRFTVNEHRSTHAAQAIRSICSIQRDGAPEPLQHGYAQPQNPWSNSDIEGYPNVPLPNDDESAASDPSTTCAKNWPIFAYQFKRSSTFPPSLPDKYKRLIRRLANEFAVRENSLFKRIDIKGKQLWVKYLPVRLRYSEMKKIHEVMGHQGDPSIGDLLKSCWWWPSLESDYKTFCKACAQCQLHQRRVTVPVQPLHPIPPAGIPFRRWGIDFIQELPASRSGNTQIITLIDYATRYVVAQAVPNRNSTTVAQFLYSVMLRFGAPDEIISDRASAFTAQTLQQYLKLQEVNHFPSSPYHPNTNGCVERMHDVLWPMILKMCMNITDKWDQYVPAAVYAINARTHTVTGYSPFYLLYGVEPKLPGGPTLPVEFDFTDASDRAVYTRRTLLQLGQDRAAAYIRSVRQAQAMADQHKRNNKITISTFKVGDKVLLKDNVKSKLDPRYKGPFVVSRVGLHDTYYLERSSDNSELPHPYNRCYLLPFIASDDYARSTGLLSTPYDNSNNEDTVV